MVAEVYKLKENSEDKLKALEMAIGQIEKSFGKGSVMKLGHNESVVDIDAISSGSLSLDMLLASVVFQKEELLKFMVQNHLEKPHWHYMFLLKLKKMVAHVHLLMLSMH